MKRMSRRWLSLVPLFTDVPMKVRTGSIAEIWALYSTLPEFSGELLDEAEFERALSFDTALLLVAEREGVTVGFKVGFDRYGDGSFYSWLGGVVPAARRTGVAKALLDEQERRVAVAGFDRVYVKTRNRFVAMLTMLLNNGYGIVGVNLPDDLPVADGRITLTKILRG